MGFNSVYRVLQDVFPQVDMRLLRAVAIEHPKDADAAVEVVLAEIIPFLPGQTAASGSSTDSTYGSYQHNRTEDEYHVPEYAGTIASTSYNDLNDDSNEVLVKHEKDKVEIWHDATTSGTLIDDNSADDDCKQLNVNVKNEEVTPLQELSSVEAGFNQDSKVSTTTSKDGINCTNGIDNGSLRADYDDFSVLFASDGNMVSSGRCWQDQAGCNQLEKDHSLVQLALPTLQECRPAMPDDGLQLAVDHTLNSDYEKPEPSDNCNSSSKKEICATERTDFEEDPALNSVVTRSGQICRIDLLEDIIESARNNKKTLFSAVESVIGLMREVELQEKAAEQAKEDAVRGGLDILTSVEDLKEMLKHAKEANDMHAGEVYGERAILATEVRELQFRLFSLSDERDKSLAILDEMHKTLEERLQASEEERKEAEQEKKEKEEAARNALAEQQLIMEKLVQESETLKQESEENSKLREFLMDRGRLVDMLQGEISVICQDVKLLKGKFDERVPLSKSLSSSQTSCILASSSSSLKSMAPDQVAEQAESPGTLELTEVTEPSLSANNHVSPGEEREGDDIGKRLVEDGGWEWFDNRDLDL